MLLNENERKTISEWVRREASDPPSVPDGAVFEQLFDSEGEMDTGSDWSDSDGVHAEESQGFSTLASFMGGERPKKPKKCKVSYAQLRQFLQQVPTRTLYAFGNKLGVIVPLVANLVATQHRVIVFGRYLKMLCIVDECLARKGISTLHFNGQLSTNQRNESLAQFKEGDTKVLLVTVGAGGEGITIVEADRVIIIDPNWNPTVDDQAIDRA